MAQLKRSNITKGVFPMSDPHFPGLNYLDIDGKLATKTKKITVAQPTLFSEPERRRTVDNPNDKITPYKIYVRMEDWMHPMQERVFCHELSSSRRKVLQSYSSAWFNVRYDYQKPMGEGTISRFAKRLNMKCQLPDFERYGNHDWRVFMVTKLANNPTVSPVDQMSFSRHKNMDSAKPYMRPAGNSQATFQRALHPEAIPSARKLKRDGVPENHVVDAPVKTDQPEKKAMAKKKKGKKSSNTKPMKAVRVSKRIRERSKKGKTAKSV